MEARIEVDVEHLGGSSTVVVSTTLEPNIEAWNENLFETMATAMNRLLAAMLGQRDHIRFEEERQTLVPAKVDKDH